MTKVTYTTSGKVRGCCGHQHQTVELAVECLLADQEGCAMQSGYSDRRVFAVEDGEMRLLNESEEEREYDEYDKLAEQEWEGETK